MDLDHDCSSLSLDSNPYIPNQTIDGDNTYDEGAALLAEIKVLKARVAALCARTERRRILTQTATCLRDVVQHLPESPVQVASARATTQANLPDVSNDSPRALMQPETAPPTFGAAAIRDAHGMMHKLPSSDCFPGLRTVVSRQNLPPVLALQSPL